MPAVLQALDIGLAPPPRKKRWTRDECAQMATLLDIRGYELIEGELIEKLPKKHPHSKSLLLVVEWLREVFGNRLVAQEVAIDVSPEDSPASEPEPDATVLTSSYLALSPRPRPGDIRLVVQVSDSTRSLDLVHKCDLYARAAIPEYWVLDLAERRMVVHRSPEAGRYQSTVAYAENESVAPLASPQTPVLVSALL